MFAPWDYVRPHYWHPMSSFEQSMMDLDSLTDSLFMRPALHPFGYTPYAFQVARLGHGGDEDDFFNDVLMDDESDETLKAKEEEKRRKEAEAAEAQQHETDRHAYSSYSYSTSSVLDKNGKRVVNTRRRYEDSNGRLKAIHDREVDGKKLKSIWHRKNKEDKGEHKSIVSSGTVEEFENLWADTPFGKAQVKKQEELKGNEKAALEPEKKDEKKDENTNMEE